MPRRRPTTPGRGRGLARIRDLFYGQTVSQPGTVFIDRDGVINRNRGRYVLSWEEFEFLPGALLALRRLHEARVRVVVLTNQSPVGRGLLTRDALDAIHARMQAAVAAGGGDIAAVLYCPHAPSAGCTCRKPRPGLLYRAAAELGIDLGTAHLIGDHVTDMRAAHAAGVPATLVLTGRGLATWLSRRTPSCSVAVDLAHAVEGLVQEPGASRPGTSWRGVARALVRQVGLLGLAR